MEVKLIQHSNLSTCVKAIRTCWQSQDKGGCYPTPTDDITEVDRKLIDRIVNKNSHKSTAEHLVYTFDIDGISRAVLQELARHRMASYSVKSTRYTLKELKDEEPFEVWSGNEAGLSREEQLQRVSKYCVLKQHSFVDDYKCLGDILTYISEQLKDGRSNDDIKHLLPEAYKTSLVMTINARSLQNFLELRTSKAALWEIQELAKAMFDVLPEGHKYLFEECVSNHKEGVKL